MLKKEFSRHISTEVGFDFSKIPKLLDQTYFMFQEEYYSLSSRQQKNDLVKEIIKAWNKAVELMNAEKTNSVEVRLKNIYKFCDSSFAINNEVESGVRYSCKRGCSACCHINVDITNDEAEILRKLPHGRENLELHKKLGHSPRSNLSKEQSACPFLKDNECSIYDNRPFACRVYHVVSDPKFCDIRENAGGMVEVVVKASVDIIRAANYEIYGCDTMANQLLSH